MTLAEMLRTGRGSGAPCVPGPSGLLDHRVGRLIDERKGGGLSDDEIDYLLANDIRRKTAEVAKALPWLSSLNGARQAVLVGMAFQMGTEGLLKFKNTLAMVQAGDFEGAGKGDAPEPVGPADARANGRLGWPSRCEPESDMNPLLLGPLFDLGGKIIERMFPDPSAKAAGNWNCSRSLRRGPRGPFWRSLRSTPRKPSTWHLRRRLATVCRLVLRHYWPTPRSVITSCHGLPWRRMACAACCGLRCADLHAGRLRDRGPQVSREGKGRPDDQSGNGSGVGRDLRGLCTLESSIGLHLTQVELPGQHPGARGEVESVAVGLGDAGSGPVGLRVISLAPRL